MCASYSTDGKWIASCSADKTVRLWDAETGELLRTLESHHKQVNTLAFRPNAPQLLSTAAGVIWLWDLNAGEMIARHNCTQEIWGLSISPDGRRVVASDGIIRDVETGGRLAQLTLARGDKIIARPTFSSDGSWIVGESGRQLMVWDGRTGRQIQALTSPIARSYDAVAISPDRKRVAAGAYSGEIELWNVRDGVLTFILKGHTDRVTGLSYSPDGRLLTSSSYDGTVRIWRATEMVSHVEDRGNSVLSYQ